MPRVICHHNGKFNIFSTVCDAFLYDNALSLEELRSEYMDEVEGFTSASLNEQVERAQLFHTRMRNQKGLFLTLMILIFLFGKFA